MKALRLFTGLCVSVLFIGAATPALALANRVFVSARSGNNLNSCDNINTPCQTFAGAVLQLNPGGEAIVLDSGGYGPVTITQAVTIEAPAGVVAFVHPPSGDAITINAGPADTVILKGLTLNGGMNNGITANTVGQLFVEHCVITGYGNDGIYFAASGGTLFMHDDDVRACGTGLLLTSGGSAARGVIRESYFSANVVGVQASIGSIVAVSDSVAAGNISAGFYVLAGAAGVNADMTLDRVQAVSNGTGLLASSPGGQARLYFAHSLVTQNTTAGAFGSPIGSSVVGSVPGSSVVAENPVYINTSNCTGNACAVQLLK